MTIKELQEALEAHDYRFAKTLAHNPHYYTLRKHWDDAEFDAAVIALRKHGIDELFYNTSYVTFYAGEWKYWTMGSPVDETILINRKYVIHAERIRMEDYANS